MAGNETIKTGTSAEAAMRLFEWLKTRGLKVAFAESMSGGLLSGGLTRIPGASSVLLGSVVCYDAASKTRILGVPEEMLLQFGAESEEVTRSMAEALPALFPEAGLILAITGSASASVNDYQISSSPGTVFICFGVPGQKLISQKWHISGSREEVLEQALIAAYDSLIRMSL
jgi:PncC family amidohydrolase